MGTAVATGQVVAPYAGAAIAAAQTTAVAHPTGAAVVGGLVETAGECALTGGGCTVVDYLVGGATAGMAHRVSAPGGSGGNNPVQVGDSGSYRSLSARGVRGDGLTPHHMPQAAHGFVSYQDGRAIVMPHSEHTQTRNYGGKSATAIASDQGLSFRDILARDVWDLRAIGGTKYNRGAMNLINYYKNNFPQFME